MLKFNHREIFCFTKRFYIANIIKIAPQLSWEAIILIGNAARISSCHIKETINNYA